MYAVIESGGKQYKVQPGDVVQIEKLEGEVGSAVKFDQVLFSSNAKIEDSKVWIGKPYLSGANVQGEIVGQGRGDKIIITKMKRRKQYRRTQGHRQEYTQVLITSLDIGAAGEKLALSAEDKKSKLASFQSHLAPKGLAMTPKTLGSRKRMLADHNTAHAAGGTPTKAAAPKTAKKVPTKKAPAKTSK
jgi:large subunit ribosomal protein L21